MKKSVFTLFLIFLSFTYAANTIDTTFDDGNTALNITTDTIKYITLGYNATVSGANLTVKGIQNISLETSNNLTFNIPSYIDLMPGTSDFIITDYSSNLRIFKVNLTGDEISHRELNDSCGPASPTVSGAYIRGVHAIDDEIFYLVVDGFSTTYRHILKINYTELAEADNSDACLDRIDFVKKLNITDPTGIYVTDDYKKAYVNNDDLTNKYIYMINMSECSATNDCYSSENYTITRTSISSTYDGLDSVNNGTNFYAVDPVDKEIDYLDDSYNILESYPVDLTSPLDGAAMNQILGITVNNTKLWTLDMTNDDDLAVWQLQFPKDVSIYSGNSRVFYQSGPLKYTNASIDLNITAIESYLQSNNILSLNFTASSWPLSLEIYNLNIESAPVLSLEIYDEESYDLITSTVSVEIFGTGYATNYTTATGLLNISGLSYDTYELRYWKSDSSRRSYFITLSDSRLNKIDLYLLNSTPTNNDYKAYQVVDESGNDVDGAILKMQRRYIECNGCFKTVEMSKSDGTGQGFLFTQLYDATYKFIIEYAGTTEKITNATTLDTRTLYFTINLQDTGIDSFFEVVEGVTGDISAFDDDTNIWSYTFNDVSNANVESARLIVKRKSTYADTDICDTTMTGSSGTLTCNQTAYINTTGQFLATAYVTTSDGVSHIVDSESFAYVYDYLTYGMSGLFFSFIIIVIMAIIGLWSPSAAIVMTIFGLIVTYSIGILYLQLTWLIGVVLVGFILVGHMKK